MKGAVLGAARMLRPAGKILTIIAIGSACGAEPDVLGSPPVVGSTAESSVAPHAGSPFERRDTPPEGVAAYLDFLGAGGVCPLPDDAAPAEVGFDVPGIPSAACAYGFEPGVTVELRLRGTDGAVQRHSAPADASGNVTWALENLPSPILGEYVLSATQGDLTVERTLLAEVDRLDVVVLPDVVRIGATARLFVAGGPADGSADAYLYRAGVGSDGLPAYVYATEVGPVELDSSGEARLPLAVRSGDPTGHYLLLVTTSRSGRPSADDERARAELEVVP